MGRDAPASREPLSLMRWHDDKVMVGVLIPLVTVGILCAAVWSTRGLDATLATFGISVGVTSALITLWGALVTRRNLDRIETGVGRLASYQRREALSAVETALSAVAAARFRSNPQRSALDSSLKDFRNAVSLARPHASLPACREAENTLVFLDRTGAKEAVWSMVERAWGELRSLRAIDQAPPLED